MAISQAHTDAWWQWATGVLNGLGAPTSSTNYRTLWNWSIKESGGDPLNPGPIVNNPLNLTQLSTSAGGPWQGSYKSQFRNIVSFSDVGSSAAATAQNIRAYPAIADALQHSIPTNGWLAGRGSAIGTELGQWGSGTNWLAWNNAPPQPSQDFLSGNAGAAGGASDATKSNSISIPGLPDPLAGIGTAITNAETSFVNTATYFVLIAIGAVLMLGGVALLAVMALGSAPEPIRKIAGTAASVTPQGRAVGAVAAVSSSSAPAAKPAPAKAPLSPSAQASEAAAKAGRGSRLSPGVRAELQARRAS